MMMVMEIWFFVIAFLAEVVGTVAGFGSTMILLPVALIFFDFKTALVLVGFVHLFGNVARMLFLRGKVQWRMWWHFSWSGVLAAVIGAVLVLKLDPAVLQLLLGVFLVGYGIFALCKPHFRLKQTTGSMVSGGVSSGFLAGLLGTGGALRGAFLSAYGLLKERHIATGAAIAIVVDGVRLPVYLQEGLLGSEQYWMLPILLVLAAAGAYAGKGLVHKLSQKLFNKIVLIALIVAGLNFIADYFM
jgi:uncharacterized membrane protein YfcA